MVQFEIVGSLYVYAWDITVFEALCNPRGLSDTRLAKGKTGIMRLAVLRGSVRGVRPESRVLQLSQPRCHALLFGPFDLRQLICSVGRRHVPRFQLHPRWLSG